MASGGNGGGRSPRRGLPVAAALARLLLSLLLLLLLLILDEQPSQLLARRKSSAARTVVAAESTGACAAATTAAIDNAKRWARSRTPRPRRTKVFRGEPDLGEDNIFFVETSCAIGVKPKPVPYDSPSGLRLSPRAACALEAAAAAHPTHRVYLVHTCRVRRRALAEGNAPCYALAALSAPNVRLWAVPFARHFIGSPLETWLAGGALRSSRWPMEHASDYLRIVLLWKYGGTYLDQDVLMIRSLGKQKNFGCAEATYSVLIGAINFASDEPGRRVTNACFEELLHYRPDLYTYNGPGVITRALQKVCNVQKTSEMTEEKCGGYHLLPTSTFYSIPWQKWKLLFTEEGSEDTMKLIGKNLAVHVWNYLSKNATVTTSSKQPYAQIARRVCPKVIAAVGDSM